MWLYRKMNTVGKYEISLYEIDKKNLQSKLDQ